MFPTVSSHNWRHQHESQNDIDKLRSILPTFMIAYQRTESLLKLAVNETSADRLD
jgi:hypothetical protein